MKCKPYSEITVEIRTQLKTVKITSNIFAVCSNIFDHSQICKFIRLNLAFGHDQKNWLRSKNIEHAQKNLNAVKIFFELPDGIDMSLLGISSYIF